MRFAICLLVVALAAVAVSTAAAKSDLKLRVTTVSPLVVAGSGFAPRERVTVTSLTTVRRKQVVAFATSAGRIRVSLGWVTQPCATAFAVRAVGAKSGKVVAKVPPRPCVPPPVE